MCWEGPGASNECSHPLPRPYKRRPPRTRWQLPGSRSVVVVSLACSWLPVHFQGIGPHNVHRHSRGPGFGHARLTFRGALPATPWHIVVLLDLGCGSEHFNPGQMGRVRSQLLWSTPYLCPGNPPGCQTSPWLREHRQVSLPPAFCGGNIYIYIYTV